MNIPMSQRAEQLLSENMDILHAMKDALMKYETIDAKQIDDLMARVEERETADCGAGYGTLYADTKKDASKDVEKDTKLDSDEDSAKDSDKKDTE